MPSLNASDVIAIVAIVAGVVGTLGAGALADRRADKRAMKERLLQARLRAIEDTQRYTAATLEHFSTVALVPDKAGLPPDLGDYPKVAISLIGDSDVVVAFFELVVSEGERVRDGGRPWTQADHDRFTDVGIAVSRALRAQEERVLAGEAPLVTPPDQQHDTTAPFVDRIRDFPT